jgi:hypothetical protein
VIHNELKELFDLFPRETAEAYLTEMKELEMTGLSQFHERTFSREDLEMYLSERKYQEMS